MHVSTLGAQRIYDKPSWQRRVRAELARWGLDRERAAKELGVSARTLRKWARELGYPRIMPSETRGLKKKTRRA